MTLEQKYVEIIKWTNRTAEELKEQEQRVRYSVLQALQDLREEVLEALRELEWQRARTQCGV